MQSPMAPASAHMTFSVSTPASMAPHSPMPLDYNVLSKLSSHVATKMVLILDLPMCHATLHIRLLQGHGWHVSFISLKLIPPL